MAQNDKPVIVTLSCEAHPSTDTHKIDRAEWEAVTPGQRLALLETLAETHVANAGGYGWGIEDPADEAMVGDRPADLLRELAEWLVSLNDPEDVDGREQRRTVALDQIITRAREALGRTEEET